MNNDIVLSICIPTYNRINSLKKQLDYFSNEDMRGIEVIVSDNCSSDGTNDFLEEYALKYSWLKININQHNIGADNNTRLLLKLAKGEYVLFLGDDFLDSGATQTLVSILTTERPNLLNFGYNSLFNFPVKKIREPFRGLYNTKKSFNTKEITRLIATESSSLMFMSVNIYKRSVLLTNEKYYPSFGTTLYYTMICLLAGDTLFIKDIIVWCNPDTSWSDRKYKVWFCDMPDIVGWSLSDYFSKNELKYMQDHVLGMNLYYCNKDFIHAIQYIKDQGRLNDINITVIMYMCYCGYKRLMSKIRNNE